MARRHDSLWRDSRLPLVHSSVDVKIPLPGITLAMVEYDRGMPLGVINYIRRDVAMLPKGNDVAQAYSAVSKLAGPFGNTLPFFTVQYDPRNWAMQLFAHNDAAYDLIGTAAWLPCTEQHFVTLLYRLRGRHLPNLERYNVHLSTAPWIRQDGALSAIDWPGQDMSVRRRAYEPEGNGVRFSARNPCADIDLAIIGERSGQVALLVDYKIKGAHIEPGNKTHQAMSNLTNGSGDQVPSMIAEYDPTGDRWTYNVLALNASAQALLYGFMTKTNAPSAVGHSCDTWTYMDEDRWWDLLEEVRRDR